MRNRLYILSWYGKSRGWFSAPISRRTTFNRAETKELSRAENIYKAMIPDRSSKTVACNNNVSGQKVRPHNWFLPIRTYACRTGFPFPDMWFNLMLKAAAIPQGGQKSSGRYLRNIHVAVGMPLPLWFIRLVQFHGCRYTIPHTVIPFGDGHTKVGLPDDQSPELYESVQYCVISKRNENSGMFAFLLILWVGNCCAHSKKVHWNLTYESIIGLMQGKELHLCEDNIHYILKPPFDGMFLTHKEIDQMRYDSELNILRVLQSGGISKVKE